MANPDVVELETSKELTHISERLLQQRVDLMALAEIVKGLVDYSHELTEQMNFLLDQILQHRVTEYTKPPWKVKEVLGRLEELEGKAIYTLDTLKVHIDGNKKTKAESYEGIKE